MSPEITIAGAAGFVGNHLARRLIKDGYSDICLVMREEESPGDIGDAGAFFVVKTNLIRETSIPTISDTKMLINLAYAKDDFDGNLKMAANMIKAAEKGRIRRIIHISTAVACGFHKGGKISETKTPCPLPGYQQNKLMIEEILKSGLPAQTELVILRPSMIIGAGGRGLDFIVNRMLSKLWRSRLVYWLLKNRRVNFVAVENVVEAIMLFVKLPHIGGREIYIISDDDDADNCYGRVEQLIRLCLGKPLVRPDIGLSMPFLRLLFRLLPMHSPPDLTYITDKLFAMGYCRKVSLKDSIQSAVKKQYAMLSVSVQNSVANSATK